MPVVESNEEMKKNMKRIKKEEAESEKIKTSSSPESPELKSKTSAKVKDINKKISGKKDEIKIKGQDVKDKASEKKDELSEGIKKTKDELSQGIKETKDEAEKEKLKLEKESEKQGMSPAEKILNDIVTRFRQGSDQINDAIVERSEESKSQKKPLVNKPLIDVLETNDTIYLIADISGIKKDDIELGISKNSVDITAIFKDKPEIKEAKFIQKERNYGKTHRKIMLSTDIKIKETKAKFKDCTLTITLPKMVEDLTKIEIEG